MFELVEFLLTWVGSGGTIVLLIVLIGMVVIGEKT